MRRPLVAGGAAGHRPLMETGGANATRIESVPEVAAVADPAVMSRGPPIAFRATNTRSMSIWISGELFFDLDIRVHGERCHSQRLSDVGVGPEHFVLGSLVGCRGTKAQMAALDLRGRNSVFVLTHERGFYFGLSLRRLASGALANTRPCRLYTRVPSCRSMMFGRLLHHPRRHRVPPDPSHIM
jgi:hypothetical protein